VRVSVEGARENLDAEIPGWDFDAVREQAESAWNAKLGRIQVDGGTKEQQRIFYSALYHCYVAPYIFNDVDGNYRGMDGEVHHATTTCTRSSASGTPSARCTHDDDPGA
jgi:putative alpha-1,2-mannosidase